MERVYFKGKSIYTRHGKSMREWVPRHSKLAAYIKKHGKVFPFRAGTTVLYLGAASGTTASHIADIT
ncbi:MAG: fibrillarin-like rRNA/tRNA 2'-O-methyltransferase, partial [Candidatus Latescibacterota bacterium]